MKSTRTLRFSRQRLFLLTLVSFVAVAAFLSIAASANRANRAAKARAELAANAKSGINPSVQSDKQGPLAPSAAVIVATLTDNVTAATKIAPGANINYTATITNNGVASPADDASNLNYSGPLDANTTLVAGSVHASPIAFNDTYNWVGNTQLDTAARGLSTVTANDVAVNAPAGTDTFTLTGIAGGATALGGTVTLVAGTGAFTYTPPLGRPNIADGASVNDSFTYTITNNVDPSLTSTGTVTITLTGRVWYLQAGAAGDGRSNTPSSSPSAMSTAADKSTDIFYIFSNGASLNGPFSVDAGQQLFGQGVNLVVNAITLFTAGAAPTTTNTAGNCVALAGAPGNNTLSGFNIGTCTGGTGITGANVGTLNVSTMTINTNGGALDLTGVGSPTVNVVLGGTTSTGGARNVNLIGLNGTVNLAGGALSGSTGNGLHADGGNAGITFTGTIQNTGARQVNIINKTGGTVALSGAIGGTGTGIFLNANNGATLNFTGGLTLSTGTNDAFTATGPGPAATSGGTINVTQNNTSIVNTLTATTGSALNIANTTIGASGVTFRSITSNGAGSANGIIVNNTGTTAGLTITANGGTCSSAATCTGGTISNKTGADGSTTLGSGIFLNNTSGVSIDRMQMNDFQNFGIKGANVTGFSFTNSRIVGINGTTEAGGGEEGPIRFDGLFTSGAFPTAQITNSTLQGGFSVNIRVTNAGGTLNRLVVDNCQLPSINSSNTNGGSSILFDVGAAGTGGTLNFTISNSTISGARSHALNFTSHGGSHMDAVVTQNKIQNADTHILSAATGIILQGGDLGAADMTYNFSCNKVSTSAAGGAKGAGIILFKATNATSGSMIGTVSGNAIGVVGQAFSGAPNSAPAIWVQDHGAGTFTTLIQNNTIVEYGEEAIDLQRTSGSSTMNASIFGNTVTPHSPDGFCGLNIEQGAVAADTGTMNLVVGNSNAGSGQQNNFSAGDSANFSDIQVLRAGSSSTVLNLSRNGSVSATVAQVLKDDNVNAAATNVFIPTTGNMNLVAGLPTLPPAIGACALPPITFEPPDGSVRNRTDEVQRSSQAATLVAEAQIESAPVPAPATPVVELSSKDDMASVLAKTTPKATAAERAMIYRSEAPLSHHAVRRNLDGSAQEPSAPTSGETVTINTVATLPAGKSITIKYSAKVNTPPLSRQVQTQGQVSGSNFALVNGVSTASPNTVDPETGTVTTTKTNIDTLMTWNGVGTTPTDWNDPTNWTQPAGGTQYAPGVSNPAVNDVVIPNVGAQPSISATDIGIYSMSLANGRTLTITNPRVLTIGGSPGGDLTLDGIISGGNLNLGTGTHVINNAGGTGSLSSANVATVLSGGTVTLNNNLQAGALAVNAGGSMNITNRTLSLNGSGPALVVPGGATFTTTGSTVIFNGTAVQQAAGIAYNNLTINNSIGLNVTGVTLQGNATVNGTLTLTSSDLDTGVFTLTQPNTTASVGASDVVGSVKRTGGPFAPAVTLTFGNPNNRITFNGAGGTKPTDLTVNLVKAAPGAPQAYPAAVARTYTISKTGGTGFTSTLRLHYLDSELGVLNAVEASLNLRWFRAAPPPGTLFWPAALPTTLDNSANWVECNAVGETDAPFATNQYLASRWTFAGLSPTAADGVVTGRIVDTNGNPVEGAVVKLDGTQNRKFITDANGAYRFENVETGGFYTVTPSRANFEFSPSLRSFNQLGQETSAIFTANPTGRTENPLDTPEYFVRQHYIDFFGREPDEAGFNFWSDQMIECGGDATCAQRRRENVSAAFYLSIEFRKTGLLVDGLYRASYGARPQFEEFMPDTRTVGLGVQVGVQGWETKLQQNKEAFAAAFVNRAAFHARYDGMDASAFVDTLIANTGVTFTSSERDQWIGGLTLGQMSRADVVMSIAENERFINAKFNDSFVMMQYFGYLRRNADPNGFAFWLNKLNQFNGNFEQAEMVKAFIVSGEYRDRFPR